MPAAASSESPPNGRPPFAHPLTLAPEGRRLDFERSRQITFNVGVDAQSKSLARTVPWHVEMVDRPDPALPCEWIAVREG